MIVLYKLGGRARCFKKQEKRRKRALKRKRSMGVFIFCYDLSLVCYFESFLSRLAILHLILRVNTYLILRIGMRMGCIPQQEL